MDAYPPAHDRHDLMLVAAFAAGDATGRDRDDAEALVASCPDCSLLLADLQAIGTATAALPPVPRARDFRLTGADAARLRPSGWRRAVAWFRGGAGAGRGGALRPLAVGLTTLGIVGLVYSATPLAGGLGSTASAPQPISESANGRNSEVVSGAADAASAAPPAALGPVQGAGGAGVGSGAQASGAASAAPVAIPVPSASVVAPDAGGGSGKGVAAPPSEAPPVPGPTTGPTTDFIAGAHGSPTPVPGEAPGTGTSTGSTAGSSPTGAPILAIGSLGCIVLGIAMLIVVRRRARAETEA